MRLDGFGLFVRDMGRMIRFYRDVLGFEIREDEDTSNVYLIKDGTLFLLYGRDDFERMTHRRYEYIKGLNGHSELALYVDTGGGRAVPPGGGTGCYAGTGAGNGAMGTAHLLYRRPGGKPHRDRLLQQALCTVTHKKPGRQIPSGLCFCHGKIS